MCTETTSGTLKAGYLVVTQMTAVKENQLTGNDCQPQVTTNIDYQY